MPLSNVKSLIEELSKQQTPLGHSIYVISEKDVELNEKKVSELKKALDDLSFEELKQLKTLFPFINIYFFAHLVIDMQREQRMVWEKDSNNRLAVESTTGFECLFYFVEEGQVTFQDPLSTETLSVSLNDLVLAHLNSILSDNTLSRLVFSNSTGFFLYLKLIPRLKDWVCSAPSEYKKMNREASLDAFCRFFCNMTHLDLSDYYVDSFPDCMDKFPPIEFLEIPWSIQKLPSSMKSVKQLNIVESELLNEEIAEEDLKKYPDAFDLNQPHPLPTGIENLTNLEHLYLSECRLKELPEIVFYFEKLKSLISFCGDIERLSPSIAKLKNLEILDFNCNALKELPKEIGQLPHLKELILEGNHLKEFFIEKGGLPLVEYINLGHNKLSSFPRSLLHLKTLKHLLLYQNEFKETPKEIEQLKNLEQLEVD